MACVLISEKVQPEIIKGEKSWQDKVEVPKCRLLLGPLFWNIVHQREISKEQLTQMLKDYDNKLRRQGRAWRHRNLKGDIEAQLRREDMTWKIFCMGLEAIGAESIDLEVSVNFLEN